MLSPSQIKQYEERRCCLKELFSFLPLHIFSIESPKSSLGEDW
jgi:hypothetical protein